jgi:hypothetical protein
MGALRARAVPAEIRDDDTVVLSECRDVALPDGGGACEAVDLGCALVLQIDIWI